MVEAVKTAASPGAIWAIIAVAVCCLAFWLTMIMIANRQQVRASGPSPLPGQRAAQAPAEPVPADAPTRPDLPVMPAQRSGEGDRAERSGTADQSPR